MASIEQIANELRALALGLDDGQFIGTEDTLTKRFGVSGPTLRKAISVLEHEEVVEVRRGVRGGFFARRPQLGTVIRIAGIFLSGHQGAMDDVPELVEALAPVLIRSALRSDRLAELSRFAIAPPKLLPHDAFIAELYAFWGLFYDVADNLPLRLCLSIFFEVGIPIIVDGRSTDRAGQLRYQELQAELAQALVARERDRATDRYLALCRLTLAGMQASLADQKAALASPPQPRSRPATNRDKG